MSTQSYEETAKQTYYTNGTGLLPFLQIKYNIGFHEAGLILNKFEKKYSKTRWIKSPEKWDKLVSRLDRIYKRKRY